MTYSSVALIALVVHCIVNYDVLTNRHYGSGTPDGKSYRWLLLSILIFYVIDVAWGVLYDARLSVAVFANTVLYFAATASTVFLWTRFVSDYMNENNRFTKAISYFGWAFLAVVGALLMLNFFVPVMFDFDQHGEYHARAMRYCVLAMQCVMYLSSACYVFITARGKSRRVQRRRWAIGSFSAAMTLLVIVQVVYSLLPLYSVAWLLGTCLIHTFVLEDQKEERRLEFEKLIRKEQAQEKELGSARRLAYRDPLTGVKSYNAYVEAQQQINERIESGELKEFGVVVFDVNGLKSTNDTMGHDAGDRLLQGACRLICERFKHSPVYRIGGDEFVALLEGEDFLNRESLLDAFEKTAEANNGSSIVVASGLAVLEPGSNDSYQGIFGRADARMYDRKRELKAVMAESHDL